MDLEQGELGTVPFCLCCPRASISSTLGILLVVWKELRKKREGGWDGQKGQQLGPWTESLPRRGLRRSCFRHTHGRPRAKISGVQNIRAQKLSPTHVHTHVHIGPCSSHTHIVLRAHVHVYSYIPTHPHMGMSSCTPTYTCTQGPNSDRSQIPNVR